MAKTVTQNRYEHFKRIVKAHGGQAKVANTMGVTRQFVHFLVTDKHEYRRDIGHNFARRIEQTFGLPLGAIDGDITESVADQDQHSVEVTLLSYLQNDLTQINKEAVHSMRLGKDWIRRHTLATSFDYLALVTAGDTSMAPTIVEDATLLVDTSITVVDKDAIYILAHKSGLFIKRVQRLLDGTFTLLSDNTRFQPQHVKDIPKAGLLVLGRVVAVWNPNSL